MQEGPKRIRIVSDQDDPEVASQSAENQDEDPQETPDAPATDQSVEELQAEIERLQAEVAQERDRHLRAVAEMQNFRKRTARENQDRQRYAGQSVLSAILPVMDNLTRVLEHQEAAGTEEFAKGVQLTVEEFFRVLASLGVTVVGSEGETFDPNVHEAVARVEGSDVPEGTVVAVDTPGYCLHDRCIRPARVVVAADRP
jgi:molecular chaperone GrpE